MEELELGLSGICFWGWGQASRGSIVSLWDGERKTQKDSEPPSAGIRGWVRGSLQGQDLGPRV